jgi:hypothetical protein
MSKPVVRFLESCSYNDPFAEIEVGTVADEWKLISEISNVLKNG